MLELEKPPQEEESFRQSTIGWLCEQLFTESVLHEVSDHDSLTGKYRGAALNKCNLNCKKSHQVLFSDFSTTFLGVIVILKLKNS